LRIARIDAKDRIGPIARLAPFAGFETR